MKIFTKKGMIFKIIIILIAVLILSLLIPNISKAADDDLGIGGSLFQPILDFLVGVADWFISFLQQSVLKMEESFVHIDRGGNFWSTFWAIVATIAVIAVGVLFIVATGGAAMGAGLLAAIKAGGTILLASVATIAGSYITFHAAKYVTSKMLPNDLWLPVIQLSPESIFTGEIPIFDIDFFNPVEEKPVYNRI